MAADLPDRSGPAPRGPAAGLPLSTLLAFAWTAITIEIDNAYERAAPHRTSLERRGAGPWLTSHAMWHSCLRFLEPEGLPLAELEARARMRTNLSGMIRWGYVTLDPPTRLRPRGNPRVLATPRGQVARDIWRPLPAQVEAAWRRRFGLGTIEALRARLAGLAARLDPDLPDGMPILGYGLACPQPIRGTRPPARDDEANSLPSLLARALLAFTLAYETATGLSLMIGANVLRLLDESGLPVSALPVASGVSKEAIAMAGGFLQRRGLASEAGAGRSRSLRLSPAGLAARATWTTAPGAIEADWRSRFGADLIDGLRQDLDDLAGAGGAALLAGVIQSSRDGWRARRPPPSTLPWQPAVLHRGGYPDGA